MRFSLHGLLRCLALLAAATGLTAVGVGRLAPRPTHFRVRHSTACIGIDDFRYTTVQKGSLFVDPETGHYLGVTFPESDLIDHAVCSPWEDDRGERQVVGRWVLREGPDKQCRAFGLARYTFPRGETLDRVPLSVIPMSRPCFDPSGSDRIIFTSGRGELHGFSFADYREAASAGTNDVQPWPIIWRTAPPGEGRVLLTEPSWPVDSRLKGRIMVALARVEERRGDSIYHPSRLWWLELNAGCTAIISAGRVILPAAGEPEEEEQLPVVAATPNGGLALAYLAHHHGEVGWRLRLAPVALDPNGLPTVDRRRIRTLATCQARFVPTFSPDGRWLYHLGLTQAPEAPLMRFSVADALASDTHAPFKRDLALPWTDRSSFAERQ